MWRINLVAFVADKLHVKMHAINYDARLTFRFPFLWCDCRLHECIWLKQRACVCWKWCAARIAVCVAPKWFAILLLSSLFRLSRTISCVVRACDIPYAVQSIVETQHGACQRTAFPCHFICWNFRSDFHQVKDKHINTTHRRTKTVTKIES